jgi:hypothetical protein
MASLFLIQTAPADDPHEHHRDPGAGNWRTNSEVQP